jgi:hypothetical protein
MRPSFAFAVRAVWVAAIFARAGCAQRASPEVAARVAEVHEARLRADVAALARIGPAVSTRFTNAGWVAKFYNPAAQAEKIAYIRSQLEPLGYTIELENFTCELAPNWRADGDLPGVNVIATKRGRTEPGRVLELGAHYDTRAGPGADDNCSGVAGVLEVARALAPWPAGKTIRFCFFDFEEIGKHDFSGSGSGQHVERIKRAPETCEGLLNFEMIGYAVEGAETQQAPLRVPLIADVPHTGNFITVIGNLRSGGFAGDFTRAAKTYAPGLRVFAVKRFGGFFADGARSDHVPYWNAGLKGVMITDTANFRNPNYHGRTDTAGTLNYPFMADVVRAATACLAERTGRAR